MFSMTRTVEAPQRKGMWPRNLRFPKAKKVQGLCKDCAPINFKQFAARPSNPVPSVDLGESTNSCDTYLLSLYDIIENQRDGKCNFCALLHQAIALPMHDPFQHPAIKDHMPEELKNDTFQSWATGLKWHDRMRSGAHPFGRSRNKITIVKRGEGSDVEIAEVRNEDMEIAQQAGLVASATATGATLQSAAQEKDADMKTALTVAGGAGTLLNSTLAVMAGKLPAAVVVKLHNTNAADAGLLEVKVLGYGNKVQAPLSVLSSFNLRVESDYKDDSIGLRYGKMIGPEVNVEDDCQVWLNHCHRHHGDLCAEPDWSTDLPAPSGEQFRLIDIIDKDDEFRVVRIGNRTPLPKYAALSYVWGAAGAAALNLWQGNISQLETRIPPESVAKTVLDAIKVAKRLGIRYLWVDSLCIVQKGGPSDEAGAPRRSGQYLPGGRLTPRSEQTQGGDDREARDSQLKQMDSIYGHAAVVIVDAAGEDANAGLAGISSTRTFHQIARDVRLDLGVRVLLPIEYDQSYGKWDTRAWTLQEKLLSKRMLVFGQNYVSFHCKHGILREDMPAIAARNGPPPMERLAMPSSPLDARVKMTWGEAPVLLRSPFFDEYAILLEQYTSRDRSNADDILSAIQGLLQVLENMRRATEPAKQKALATKSHGHTLLHGLPEEYLDLALLWQPPAVTGTYLTRRTNEPPPSWSWAGWEVSKEPVPDVGKTHRALPGVRFEEPFLVSAYEDMSLRKFQASGNMAEERFRPLVMWYKWVADPEPATELDSSSDHSFSIELEALQIRPPLQGLCPPPLPARPPLPRTPPPPVPVTPPLRLLGKQARPRSAPPPPKPRPKPQRLRPISARSSPVDSHGPGFLSVTPERQWAQANREFRASLEAPASPHMPTKPMLTQPMPMQPMPTQPTTTGKLVPVNGHGLGIVCGSVAVEAEWLSRALQFRNPPNDSRLPQEPGSTWHTHLNDRHLVCQTQVCKFKVLQTKKEPREEILWDRVDKRTADGGIEKETVVAKTLQILEADILDDDDMPVGRVVPTGPRTPLHTGIHSFILLSESQYWGDEERVDVVGYPLYNVMLVEWDATKQFATRLGLGKITKEAWAAKQPGKRVVVLN